MAEYDCLVVGCGGVGSAALMHFARRGARVLGVDRWLPPHEQGSSHGQTRLIRLAYFEHPDYVPLLREAFQGWEELAGQSGEPLLNLTGLLEVGPAQGPLIQGVLRSAGEHSLPIEHYRSSDFQERFPGFELPSGHQAVFEQQAGFLPVEDCVRICLQQASEAGAEFCEGISVTSWSVGSTGVLVQGTDRQDDSWQASCDSLVVTAGSWAGELLADLGIPLTIRRKSLFWFDIQSDVADYTPTGGTPAFYFELSSGDFYGVPAIPPWGLKVGQHTGGATVSDPACVNRSVDPAEQQSVQRFLRTCLKPTSLQVTRHRVCLYTDSPDGHFIVDRHPQYPQVLFAAGLSGHGFKFAPVLGQALVDLALDQRTELPVDFLGLDRFWK